MYSIADHAVFLRNKITKGVYENLLKPVFFRNDPEVVHDHMTELGSVLGKHAFLQGATNLIFNYKNPKLEQTILGIKFCNPIGLAAGFDKNAKLTEILGFVGFGFEEVGSITAEECEGNKTPRLWRLKESKGLVVNYGLKNDGSIRISRKLKSAHANLVLGTSIAMTNCKDNCDVKKAIFDYAKSFKIFADIGQYFAINISCPNISGSSMFLKPHNLDYLLDILDEIETSKPIFLKISPDLSLAETEELLSVASQHKVSGIICANLTKKRDNNKLIDQNIPSVGGISGKPVGELSDKLISYIYKNYSNRFIIIGCGGIFNAEDAYRKIKYGASLLQLITGMVFEGPQLISDINLKLVEFLERDGYKNISEAVGKAVL